MSLERGDEMKYDYQEAYNASLEYFSGDELAANVVTTKYLLTDKKGNYLESSPREMHQRICFRASSDRTDLSQPDVIR